MSKKSLTSIHIRALISSMEKFFQKLDELRKKEQEYKRQFYSHMKAEVENLRNNALTNNILLEDESVQKHLERIESLWEKVEAEMGGCVLIITRDPIYFWKKMKLWHRRQNVLLAESIEEGIEICSGRIEGNAREIRTVIVDPSVVERFDDIEKLKSLAQNISSIEIKVTE